MNILTDAPLLPLLIRMLVPGPALGVGYILDVMEFWTGATGVDAYEFRSGTLVIDLIDAKSGRMVWRGVASMRVVDSMKKNREAIPGLVHRLLRAYPPEKH